MNIEVVEEDGIVAACGTEGNTVACAVVVDTHIVRLIDIVAGEIEAESVESYEN